MVCGIAENLPLQKLSADLGEHPRCHSRRGHCVRGLSAADENAALGAPGAAIGYCQALFTYAGDPKRHSEKVSALLLDAGAPWARSHELYWSFRGSEEPVDFVTSAMTPLRQAGRVPVLITRLDPAEDLDEIRAVFGTTVPLARGETILVRLVLGSEASLGPAVELLRDLVTQAKRSSAMPQWWPLFQSGYSAMTWARLAVLAGPAWKYVNLAVNPFTDASVLDRFPEQITVAQLPIGLADGIGIDGNVRLAKGMAISGANGRSEWSLPSFFTDLAQRGLAPTLIVLGPSLPDWSDAMNATRIMRFVPALKEACSILWSRVSVQRQKLLLGLSA